ncbi:MAG: hypothetical protein ACRCU6_05810, partial [Fusobacteriaceae bacterium]
EIICLIEPSDYLKNLHKYLGAEYKKRFGKPSRYALSWALCDIKKVPAKEYINSERNKLYNLVAKGVRIEWKLEIPYWWSRQENKGRLWCKYIQKRNPINKEEFQLENKSHFREVLEENKKISKENKTKKISEKILIQKYLEGADCYKIISENLRSQLEDKKIQEVRKEIKKRLGGKKVPNRKVVKKWLESEYPIQFHINKHCKFWIHLI